MRAYSTRARVCEIVTLKGEIGLTGFIKPRPVPCVHLMLLQIVSFNFCFVIPYMLKIKIKLFEPLVCTEA